ncbi:hypothetical protein [Corallococcus sicarius]|nr:hypothetical protein [Corallococcus sicarius]
MQVVQETPLTGEVRPPGRSVPSGGRRGSWLAGMVAALGLWGCGDAAPPVTEAPGSTSHVQSDTAALTCAPGDITSGEFTCSGQFNYSLECFARQPSAVCGDDTTPKTCTTYGTCGHEDFGKQYVTRDLVWFMGTRPEGYCEMRAQNYVNTTVAEADRPGVTWSWLIGGPPEPDTTGGGDYCYITFENYPELQVGTGPQCGTVDSACTVACQNPKTCQVNGAWVTDATQCGTMVGPCGTGSGPRLYNACRDASHGLAPDADCGAGFEAAQAPGNSTQAQVEAQAAAQWTASGSRGAPVYDAPITCSQCTPTFSLSAAELNRRVYSAVAMSKEAPKLNLMAGAAYILARDNPTLTQAELTTGINAISVALDSDGFDPTKDGAGPTVRVMLRMLSKAEPNLSSTSVPHRALRSHARALLARMQDGLDVPRGLDTPFSQVVRYAEAAEFTQETWGNLYALAQGNVALAGAVDNGGIGAALGVHTTQGAVAMLNVKPLGPLKAFVNANLVNGRLITTPTAARAFVTTASTDGLAAVGEYSDMLDDLNVKEQAYRDALALKEPVLAPPAGASGAGTLAAVDVATAEAELKIAIAAAKVRGTQLKGQFEGVREGVTTGLGLVAALFGMDGSSQFAADVLKFSKALDTTLEAVAKYAESSVKIAEKVVGVLDLGQKSFQIVSAAVFSGQIVGAVVQLFSLLRKPAEPPIEEVILKEVRELHQRVAQMQEQMLSRFDRVDRRLRDIHRDMEARFALVDWNLGRVNQNVEEAQRSLYALQADLNRVDQNMYAYFNDMKDDYFTGSAWLYLGWDSRHPVPMDYTTQFALAEADFSQWGAVDAKTSVILAGIDGRGSNAAISPVDELSSRPLSHNINYLREFPVQLPQQSMLASQRISSPKDWTAGAQAYARLFEEQPAHGAAMLSTRHGELLDAGTALETALKGIGKPLFAALHTRYQAEWDGLKTLIDEAEVSFRNDPNMRLYGIDLWGPPEQEPTKHFLKGEPKAIVPCAGGQWADYDGNGAADYLEVDPSHWNHDVLRPLLISDSLNVDGGTMDLCGEGRWQLYSEVATGFGGYYERKYRLQTYVYVRYTYLDESETVKSDKVFTHVFTGGHEFNVLVRDVDRPNYNPNSTEDPQEWMAKQWLFVRDNLVSTNYATGDATRTYVRNRLVPVLKKQQQKFYTFVAARMQQGGDVLQLQAKRLTGTRLVWQAYVALALPLSLEHDENLRGLLYGEEGLMSGDDTALDVEADPVINDVWDMYDLFSRAATPPDHNIMADLHPTLTSRADRLKVTLDALVDAQATSGGPEASAWVEATMLRLRLSRPQ